MAWGVVELFAGLGSVARAFEATGCFESILLTDHDARARDTVIENDPRARYLVKDVTQLSSRDVMRAADGRRVVGFLGCPPCQGFSPVGRRDPLDRRNGLLADYFRLLAQIRPAFFVIENVPSVYQYGLLADLLSLVEREYVVWRGVLNAALYGVPQTRQRAILIGYRRDLGVSPRPPQPTHLGSRRIFDYRSRQMLPLRPETLGALLGESPRPWSRLALAFETVMPSWREPYPLVLIGEALGDLGPPGNATAWSSSSEYAKALGSGSVPIANHEAWRHSPAMRERFASIPEGGVPADLAGRGSNRKYFSQAYARLHRDGIARTITTSFHNAGSGRFLHPLEHRTVTVREAARLQGIHDVFRFVGDRSVQERHVGNAFPPPLATAIARRVARDLRAAGY